MKKEYKDFYRFLWDYLESGKSAFVIKPRQVGITCFAARYAAWCLDYKDMEVEVVSVHNNMEHYIRDMIKKFRVQPLIADSTIRNKKLRIFDEIDFIDNHKLHEKMVGTSNHQYLAYTTVNKLNSISLFKTHYTENEVNVFDISNFTENKFYEEQFYRKR
jgi:hypothetical protein